jgi:hypothetical protein
MSEHDIGSPVSANSRAAASRALTRLAAPLAVTAFLRVRSRPFEPAAGFDEVFFFAAMMDSRGRCSERWRRDHRERQPGQHSYLDLQGNLQEILRLVTAFYPPMEFGVGPISAHT